MKLKKFKEIDHKKRSVIIFTIICILLISGVFLYRTFAIFETNDKFNLIEGNVGSIGDITFSVYIDNELVKEVPEKGTKVFDSYHSYCENGSIISWNEHSWEASIKNLSNTKTKCHLKFISGYEESTLNGAIPDLGNGKLTPITIENNGIVKKADLTKEWYSYENKKWANAVILKENSYELLNANGKIYGEPTMEEDSLHLDGIDDIVDLGLENYDFKDQITMALTFKLNDLSNARYLIGNWESGGGGIHYDKNAICFSFFVVNKYYDFVIPFEDTMNFHTIIVRVKDKKIEGWLDNQKISKATDIPDNIKVSPTSIVIGANPNGNENVNYANINVKQAAVFNRAIGEDEIANLSNENFKITNSEGLLKYVDFTQKKYTENEVIPEDNIESYFVWIPRYKYQLFAENPDSYSNIEKDLGIVDNNNNVPNISETTQINITFETNDVAASNGNIKGQWLTHPAFTSFDNNNGFWIGKFESGYMGAKTTNEAQKNEKNSEKLIIKPNVYSWRNINVSNAFYTTYEYERELESYMMKNTEWGAVAYLAQSKYGRFEDNNFSLIIFNNNRVTGYSAKNEPTCGYTGTNEVCNKYETNVEINQDGENGYNYFNEKSIAASTTKNYYGVYDVSGGSWEYVMGVLQGASNEKNEPASGPNSTNNSGFNGTYSNCKNNGGSLECSEEENKSGKIFPDKKYYDLYDYDTIIYNYQRGHLGDATKEFGPFLKLKYRIGLQYYRNISSYSANHAHFISNEYPWFSRGGNITDGSANGIAAFNSGTGIEDESTTFRTVLTP